MKGIQARFVGVELYSDDLERAKKFYVGTLGLEISDEQVGHHAKFYNGAGFVRLERKGSEPYPSKDKAVLFFVGRDPRSRRSQRTACSEIRPKPTRDHGLIVKETAFEVLPLHAVVEINPMPRETNVVPPS